VKPNGQKELFAKQPLVMNGALAACVLPGVAQNQSKTPFQCLLPLFRSRGVLRCSRFAAAITGQIHNCSGIVFGIPAGHVGRYASHLGDSATQCLLLPLSDFHRAVFPQAHNMSERLSQITYEALPSEVRPLADDILKVSSAALGGPYNALLRSPDMARRAFDFLDYLRFKTSVNKRLNEWAILIQARISNAQYEWWAHERIARKAGLSDAVMRELQQCQRPQSMQADERLVYDYCVQLSLNHRVSDDLWQEAVSQMGEQAVVDLTVLSGTYVMVSMLLNATQVGIPDGSPEPLQVLSPLEIRQRLLA